MRCARSWPRSGAANRGQDRAKRQDRLRQAGAISQEALACSLDSGQRIFFRSLEPPAAAHHEDQQRRAPLERLSIKANDIPRKFSFSLYKPENLLPSRVGYLFLAELGGVSNGAAEVDSAVPTPKASILAPLCTSVSMRSSSSSPDAKICASCHPA